MHYNGLLRVPLIVRGPGVQQNAVVSEPVSTIDMAPAVFDYARCEPLLNPHGESLKPLPEGRELKRESALAEWELLPTRAGVALSLRVVRTATHKLTVDFLSGVGELYDPVDDPGEMKNRFDDPGYSEGRAQLESYLMSRVQDQQGLPAQVGLA